MSAPPNPVCAENADLAVTESLTCFCIRDCLIPTVPAGKDRLDAWRLKQPPRTGFTSMIFSLFRAESNHDAILENFLEANR